MKIAKRIHNLEYEESLLGCFLYDNSLLSKIKFNELYFYSVPLGRVYASMKLLDEESQPVTHRTLLQKMQREIDSGRISEDVIFDLEAYPAAEHARHFAKVVQDFALEREALRLLERTKEKLGSNYDQKEAKKINLDTVEKIHELYGQRDTKPFDSHEVLEKIINQKKDTGDSRCWNFFAFDCHDMYFTPGSIIVIGGRPGHCKTSFALRLVDGWLRMGKKVFLQSMEMSEEDLYTRRLSSVSKIPGSLFRKHVDKDQAAELVNAASILFQRDKNLTIFDVANLTRVEIIANIKSQHRQKGGLDFFVLDHFHLIAHDSKNELAEMTKDFAEITGTCKNLGITSVILSQFSRGIEHERGKREPHPADLRGCGRMEQDADIVLLMHWLYQYTMLEADKNKIKIKCAKIRNGSRADFLLDYDPAIYKFGEMT